eukprot:scaffold142535_cov79-Attheya_sp.AAC.2
MSEPPRPSPMLPAYVQRCKPGPFRQSRKRKLQRVSNDAPFSVARGRKMCPKMSRKSRSLMQPAVWVNFHPFAKTLRSWEKGVPVDCALARHAD